MQKIAGCVERRATVRGLDFAYLEWGDASAPSMVLLHGLTGHAHIWDHMAPALAERFHVFALDQRGHGDSAHAETYETQQFVDDLEAMVRHWGIERFVLMGLSMGGHNAFAYAAQHPPHVSRLIVIDIPPKMRRTQAPNWDVISRLAETGHKRYTTFADALKDARAGTPTAPEPNLIYRTEHNLAKQPDGTMVLKYDAKVPARWDPADLTDVITKIDAPTLIVRGGLTTVLPRDVAERMSASMRDAELVQVDDSGHSVPTDRPEKLAPIVLDWLARRER